MVTRAWVGTEGQRERVFVVIKTILFGCLVLRIVRLGVSLPMGEH